MFRSSIARTRNGRSRFRATWPSTRPKAARTRACWTPESVRSRTSHDGAFPLTYAAWSRPPGRSVAMTPMRPCACANMPAASAMAGTSFRNRGVTRPPWERCGRPDRTGREIRRAQRPTWATVRSAPGGVRLVSGGPIGARRPGPNRNGFVDKRNDDALQRTSTTGRTRRIRDLPEADSSRWTGRRQHGSVLGLAHKERNRAGEGSERRDRLGEAADEHRGARPLVRHEPASRSSPRPGATSAVREDRALHQVRFRGHSRLARAAEGQRA
jgi:hypothetical protein